jgi:hypothetical protein
MNEPLGIGVDTIEFVVHGKRLRLPGTTTATLSTDDGEVTNSYQNRIKIASKYGVHNLNVRTKRMGTVLFVEGSPYGFRYGQNAFLPGDVRYACVKALGAVCRRYDLKPSGTKMAWDDDDICLQRVDLVLNFQLASQEEVIDTITQIRRQFTEQRTRVDSHPSGIHWLPGGGREYSFRFYSKWLEMRNSKRPKGFPEFERLLDECEGVLRVELQLRKEGLLKLGLDKASFWKADSAEKAFRQYMKRLPLLTVTSGPLAYEELEDLAPRLRPVLAAHKAGYDLEKIFGTRSLQRYRQDFKEFGIDLRCPNQPEVTTISVKALLMPQRALKKPPKWMREAGLYPGE